MNKIFLDTNIVADIIGKNRTNHSVAMQFFEKLIDNEKIICISEDMITTIFYISKEKKETLEFLQNVVFVDWEILNFTKDILCESVKIALDNNLDLEDVLQSICAKTSGCEMIITGDKKFYNCGINILDMHKYLAEF